MPGAFHSREFLSRHLKDRVYERAVSPAAPLGPARVTVSLSSPFQCKPPENNPLDAVERCDRSLHHGELLVFSRVSAIVPEVTAAARRSRMDDCNVRRERDCLEWWPQHVRTHFAIAAVDVFNGDVNAAFRALEVSDSTQPKPERGTCRASVLSLK